MKATGVVRRIDELGRIVIPKEIRKTLRIKEGENLEIFIDDKENVVLKKYSLMNKIEDFAQNFTDSINSLLKHNIIITDNDSVIAVSGKYKKKYLNKSISSTIENMLLSREKRLQKHNKKLSIKKRRCTERCVAVFYCNRSKNYFLMSWDWNFFGLTPTFVLKICEKVR